LPFLTENVLFPSFSTGFVARSSSTEPAQVIGEAAWQVTSMRAIPFAPTVIARGPRTMRGACTRTGVLGLCVCVGTSAVGDTVVVGERSSRPPSLTSIVPVPRAFVIVPLMTSSRVT
jgi:ABC-type proline/glycine betaine transport system permease subunit